MIGLSHENDVLVRVVIVSMVSCCGCILLGFRAYVFVLCLVYYCWFSVGVEMMLICIFLLLVKVMSAV